MAIKSEITFIDLFAGIGGFRRGLESEGFNCVFSSEIDEHCQQTYQKNYKEWPKGDITLIPVGDIPHHHVLAAGFPCQPFSISGRQFGFEDTRGTLFFDILRIVQAKKPQVVLLENVKHLVHHDKGRTFLVMLDRLKNLGYCVSWKVLNASDFGVPQNRERIIIIASLNGFFDFNVIKKVPRVKLKDFLDKEGEFEYLPENEYTLLENPTVQRSGLIFAGYRNKKIRKNGVRPNTKHLSRVHKQPNRIYSTEGIHPTLSSQETSGRFFILHGGQVRKLTIEEWFRIMGFKEDFMRVSPISELYKQIGNSVCIPMIQELGKGVKKQFFSEVQNDGYSYGNTVVNI